MCQPDYALNAYRKLIPFFSSAQERDAGTMSTKNPKLSTDGQKP